MKRLSENSLPAAAVVWLLMGVAAAVWGAAIPSALAAAGADGVGGTIRTLAAIGERRTGTEGFVKASDYVRQRLESLGLGEVESQRYAMPLLRHGQSRIELPGRRDPVPVHPFFGNAITPGTLPAEGLEGPVIYVADGQLERFNGKTVEGAIVLMEMDSGRNWLHAANLGARALIYVDRGPTDKIFFEEKLELSPISFPRFWMPLDTARELFGPFESHSGDLTDAPARLFSDVAWEAGEGENLYCLVPGADPGLKEELIIVETFFDSSAWLPGLSPGADEACGIATLLEFARSLKEAPAARSILLVATGGHGQSLAGMREMIWSLDTRSKNLREDKRNLKKIIARTKGHIKVLKTAAAHLKTAAAADGTDALAGGEMAAALEDRLKTEVDQISRRLMRLRMESGGSGHQAEIQKLADQRMMFRRLTWRGDFSGLSDEERHAVAAIIPGAVADFNAVLSDARKRDRWLQDAQAFRSLVRSKELAAVISLHLSSHGDGVGAFNRGWMYPLKDTVNRVAPYSLLDEELHRAAAETQSALGIQSFYHDTLRPSRLRSWDSYFLDHPYLGGEVSSLAGMLGITLVTCNDGRPYWGTPYDTPDRVDTTYAAKQAAFVEGLIRSVAKAPKLQAEDLPRNGFASITAKASFLRQGELFADQPAPGTMVLAFQGLTRHYAMVDAIGAFELKGLAWYKLVIHKVIIEGYRFDPANGRAVWAIDKQQTGKEAYRVKMRRRFMETDLVLFACRGTTLLNLLEPRSFNFMTKIQPLDARREALPLRYWYSRIDTWQSTLCSLYLEPGSRWKLTLSDTILRKRMILLDASPEDPQGSGYPIDDLPILQRTEYHTARDMWNLLQPRIANLERHGIYNERIRQLQREGTDALRKAEEALAAKTYDRYSESALRSWALASRVYDQVEETQKDVLFGVLFYIALFVPFAFCMERFLFGFTGIHQRILAFLAILLLLILVIYNVHPAFQLAYSPTVVILAFFIMGLSLIVTLIIFFRFEDEMVLLQQRATHLQAEEISRWKAFLASFFLGVSNLRRRRLRTTLTCLTLIILTFTIMSFTSVKSIRHHARLLFTDSSPYKGFLLKNANWQDLPPEAFGILSNAFESAGSGDGGGVKRVAVPRVWLETETRTDTTRIPIQRGTTLYEAKGMIGLSPKEGLVTGMDRILSGGRWFRGDEKHAILLPERMARGLGIDVRKPDRARVTLWGVPFEVVGVFPALALSEKTDLDGEPLTPAIFPSEISQEISEVEMEAIESGDEVRAFQTRYQHVDGEQTVIIPYDTLLAAGGHLKAVAVRSDESAAGIREEANDLVDRFRLTLFSGEPDGTYMYQASDTMSYSGVPNIIIPILISVFIVLNTMIGSVYERKREIGIYTSVGLAPSHVSFLFIAEAMAFAVLSVVLGYLLAQTTASLFAGTRLWAGITVNYSSVAGVAAMILVILVVLVSVIYPSKVAGEIAIPDVNRAWTLPVPKDNAIEITLPFLMKQEEHRSVAGFLYDYFNSHRDISHGLFSTGDIRVDLEPGPERLPAVGEDSGLACPTFFRMTSKVWLAPFDFGIMQAIDARFCPSEEEAGFLEIRIRINRLAGESNTWKRINKGFLNHLRKQLLVWRSLGAEAHDRYAQVLSQAGAPSASVGLPADGPVDTGSPGEKIRG